MQTTQIDQTPQDQQQPSGQGSEFTRLLGVAAVRDVLAERQRQQEVEGWTPEHDDQHACYELSQAARCYAEQAQYRSWLLDEPRGELMYQAENCPASWPDEWSVEWWKPKNPRRDLVRAAAMILAEIERLDRAAG